MSADQLVRDIIEKLRNRIDAHTRQLINLNTSDSTDTNILRGRIREAEAIIKILMKPEP